MLGIPVVFVFFFQAEGGIRDAQESRGLGDVYKRQILALVVNWKEVTHQIIKSASITDGYRKIYREFELYSARGIPVSYTHLTLPTTPYV
ncbi:putative monovalent cation/H+ antiporter subunit A [Clostridioides difficile]|nr:putative monovalent cation/H+ antiporter subunit A [Clostridioides difficile]